MTAAVVEDAEGITIQVQVVPRASRERVGPLQGERVKVQITAPPVDGAANDELVKFLSNLFAVSRADVRILGGETSRSKLVEIEGVSEDAVRRLAETGR